MKFKYIIASFVVLATVAVACEKEEDHYLDEVKLSSSYLAIPLSGGSTSTTIEATSNWSISGVPGWLTVNPSSGTTGTSTITFSAQKADYGREAELLISCADKTQYLNLTQGVVEAESASCADVISGPEGKTFRVTGTCTAIANTSYGNWYLDDGTGQIYIYGTVDSQGSYNWSSFNIEVGDVVTVEGPKVVYQGTVELSDASFISVKKSLLKIDSDNASFDSNGGNFEVRVAYKGNGAFFTVSDNAKDWIQYSSVEYVKGVATIYETNPADTAVFKFKVLDNNAGDSRTGNVIFSSYSGSNSSSLTFVVAQAGLLGTLANPFTVAQAIDYCNTLSGTSVNQFYVKGKISRITNNGEFGSYGNATFYISDDGEFLGENDKNCDKTHDFEAYRILFLGNQKWAAGNAQIAVGDEVLILGNLTLYNGISETASGKAYIYSINGVTDDANGVGNVNAPFNVAGAKACIDAGCENNVFVKGIISQIDNKFGAQYGNGTFWISDDGEYHSDKAIDFEAYRVLWLGNRKWVETDSQIAVGDNVILCGHLTKYGSTYETSSGKAWIYSLNGKTE
ncbi:MAG: BACON domain-containing protein [Bacteroidales bacterium]|nr:BACON domain-containing protein [Bacteroidales bacterium]MBQ6577855.1 BACON domain-containing protein [Bacteroidales bacterium]